ncbi:hypothetical protein LGK95_01560 [Clostridium algoriphilum]|uniref:hypothetical protein n=1 Tax=Clostridium algoriphilum TaxID=198347 RepID=UPI001CF38CC7|nr:hypothetical protein [Clostridium algoriphilum]MCB2292224.1 hypothetical protein [Clostridium algoriphilum]
MESYISDMINKNIEWSEEAVTSDSNNIQQTFEMNIHNGKGFYQTGLNNSFWSNLIITAKILNPQDGYWGIIIRDGARRNLVVYENKEVLHDKEISFNYKTGIKVNLIIEAIWNQKKNTTLSGEISIRY